MLILRRSSLFAALPEPVLARLADLLTAEELSAGSAVVHKDDEGTSMYLIAEGEVRVHDGQHTLNYLGPGDCFGELALLDAAPRVASVTALSTVRLLRLDRVSFFELIEERGEVVRALITVLSDLLRARANDLAAARATARLRPTDA
jgi:CRP-like cAMP-binding protein